MFTLKLQLNLPSTWDFFQAHLQKHHNISKQMPDTPYSQLRFYQFWTAVSLNTDFLVKILTILHTSRYVGSQVGSS